MEPHPQSNVINSIHTKEACDYHNLLPGPPPIFVDIIDRFKAYDLINNTKKCNNEELKRGFLDSYQKCSLCELLHVIISQFLPDKYQRLIFLSLPLSLNSAVSYITQTHIKTNEEMFWLKILNSSTKKKGHGKCHLMSTSNMI